MEKSSQLRLCAVFFFFDKVTASGRMSGQYVYSRSFRGILNNKSSQLGREFGSKLGVANQVT